jgi:DNA-binding beta-propeller fold protein YncE
MQRRRIVLASLLAALVAGPTAAQSAPVRVYVPNQMGASISVLDGEGTLLTTVDLRPLGFSAHAMPHQVAAMPDGSAWFVTLAGDGFLLKFDRENRLVARTPFAVPGMVVVDPARDRVYASRALGAVSVPSSLGVFRASDLALLDEPGIFIPRPYALAVDTVSGRVYAGSLSANQLASWDPALELADVTEVAGPAHVFVGLATSPDGRRLAATTQLTNLLIAFDASGPGPLRRVGDVPVEAWPYDAAWSPDGRTVWFPNQRAGSVTRVDATSWTVTAVIRDPAFQEPHGVVLTPDSRTVYVSSHGRVLGEHGGHAAAGHDMDSPRANGSLAVIDAATGAVRRVIEVGPYAAALGLSGAN